MKRLSGSPARPLPPILSYADLVALDTDEPAPVVSVGVDPDSNAIYYLPQRPYMTTGSLREQVIYPLQQRTLSKWREHRDRERFGGERVQGQSGGEEERGQGLGQASDEASFLAAQAQLDQQITDILRTVKLGGLLTDLENGLDTEADWAEVLSGGEVQRLSIARLFYHQPALAILDESTSAVSEETEDILYQECLKLGITLLTVSHRNQLRKHHQFVLHLAGDGSGSYSLEPTR